MVKYMAVAVAVAGSGGGAVALPVPVAGLTKRFFNHIEKDFSINVWGFQSMLWYSHTVSPLLDFTERKKRIVTVLSILSTHF